MFGFGFVRGRRHADVGSGEVVFFDGGQVVTRRLLPRKNGLRAAATAGKRADFWDPTTAFARPVI